MRWSIQSHTPWSVQPRALLGLVLVVGVLTGAILVDPETVATAVGAIAEDPMAFFAAICLLYLLRPVFAWPTTPLAVVVGYGLGFWPGVVIALVGVGVTVVPTFVVARWIADGESSADLPFEGVLTETNRRLVAYYDTTGSIRGVAVSRLVPIPSDIATCAAAVSGVSLGSFVVGTVLGETPWTVAGVLLGASVATLTASAVGDVSFTVILGCLLVAAALLSGPTYRVLQKRFRQHPPLADR